MANKCTHCGGNHYSGHCTTEQERLAKALAETRKHLLNTPCSTCGKKHLGAC